MARRSGTDTDWLTPSSSDINKRLELVFSAISDSVECLLPSASGLKTDAICLRAGNNLENYESNISNVSTCICNLHCMQHE